MQEATVEKDVVMSKPDSNKRKDKNRQSNISLLDVTYSKKEIMMISQYYYMIKKADFPVSCQ